MVGAHVPNKHKPGTIMFADMSLLAGLAAPVTPVSWRSHRVNELSPVPLQRRPWVCLKRLHRVTGYVHSGVKWCWGRVCEKGENERTCRLSCRTIGPSEDRKSAIDLAIIRADSSRPQMFLRRVDGKAQVADALTKLHGDGDLLRAVFRQAFTVLVEALRSWLPDVKKRENMKGYRESSHL